MVVLPISYPAVLDGQANGKLDPAILRVTPGLAGGPNVRLVETATRCWVAMSAAAQKAGIILKVTSSADSYRTYQQQVNLFTSRYQLDPTGNGWRLWDSDGNGVRERWYKKDGIDGKPVATAAVPGTSNHGLAIALDIANANGSRLAWMESNVVRFGFSWELIPEEPWHIRNVTGDDIPAAVLAYEQEQDMSAENAYNADAATFATITMNQSYRAIVTPQDPAATAVVTNALALAVIRLEQKLDQALALLAELGEVPPGPVPEHIHDVSGSTGPATPV